MDTNSHPDIQFEDLMQSIKERIPTQHINHYDNPIMTKNLPLKNLLASDHLSTAEPHISERLLTHEKFKDILSVAQYFPGNITTFLGFECHLGTPEARADWAFAISGVGEDRQVLKNILTNGYLPQEFLKKEEWIQIREFAKAWADQKSILFQKVKCFWLEFDMPEKLQNIPIPSVFFGPIRLPNNAATNDITQYEWLINDAIPLLKGNSPSEKTIEHFYHCIQQMPLNTSLFQVGTMLSRTKEGIRLYINRIELDQIMPYLTKLGWEDQDNEFTELIEDLEDKSDRFVLSFDVNEGGIGKRIGIECSFISDDFQNDERWEEFLDYLVDKGMCVPEKRDALLEYSGIENVKTTMNGKLKPLISASKILDDISSYSIARYINHIKIVYRPEQPMEAKAYPAIRYLTESILHEEVTKMK